MIRPERVQAKGERENQHSTTVVVCSQTFYFLKRSSSARHTTTVVLFGLAYRALDRFVYALCNRTKYTLLEGCFFPSPLQEISQYCLSLETFSNVLPSSIRSYRLVLLLQLTVTLKTWPIALKGQLVCKVFLSKHLRDFLAEQAWTFWTANYSW